MTVKGNIHKTPTPGERAGMHAAPRTIATRGAGTVRNPHSQDLEKEWLPETKA